MWLTLPRRCVRCSAWASGCRLCSWVRTALPVPLHSIYGKNMARIRGMDQLARAAGRLIQNEIRELGD